MKTIESIQERNRRLVVIGGVAAGMSAASRAKRVDPNLDVVVLEKGDYISYGACSLPYYVAGHFDDWRTLIARTPEQAAKQGVDVRTGHEAIGIDVGAGFVKVRTVATGTVSRVPFDALVVATGAAPILPRDWALDDMDGAFMLRNIDDARALRQWIGGSESSSPAEGEGPGGILGLAAKGARRAVVIGGGYIGVEAVDVLLERGLSVHLVDMAPQLLTNFDEDMAAHVEKDLRAAGVEVRLGDPVAALETREGRCTGVRLGSGTFIEADVAVVALGVRPNVDLAREAGIRIGATGAIAVDERQRTNFPHVYAAGDCAEAFHLVAGTPTYIPLGTTANKQGRVAGTNIGGGDERFPGIVGTAVLKAHRISLGRTGLTGKEAEELGHEVAVATITAPDRVHSYPGVQDVIVKLIAERDTGKLLGAQVAGREPLAVSGRIDVVATALTRGMTVDAFGHLDLSYAPPFAPVWDPLLVAANVLQRQL